MIEFKICRECGSMDYTEHVSWTTWGSRNHKIDSLGEYTDEGTDTDDNDSGENIESVECSECSSYVDNIELDEDKFDILFNLPPELRPEALCLMEAGEEVDPETGKKIKIRKGRKDPKKIGGRKLIQE